MVEGLVTVVLPIYKVEKYLDRCIESVVAQSYEKLEIILVDDGSPDSCGEICDGWAQRDPRIRVIHKQNAGLGMARNTGIDNARGEYILFFDSDDYVERDTVEVLYNTATATGAELVLFGYSKVSREGQITETQVPSTEKALYCGREVREIVLPALFGPHPETGKSYGLLTSACTCMYAAELLRKSGWHFVSEREYLSEDAFSLLTLYANVESVAVVPRAFYHYCVNDSSLSHSFRSDRLSSNLFLYKESIALCDKNAYPQAVKTQVAYFVLSNLIGGMKSFVCAELPLSERYGYIREIVRSPGFQKILEEANKKGDSPMRKILLAAAKMRLSPLVYALVALKRKTE